MLSVRLFVPNIAGPEQATSLCAPTSDSIAPQTPHTYACGGRWYAAGELMPQTSEQILQQEFLAARAKILELAATLDRIDRAGGSVGDHPQMQLLQRGFNILREPSNNRAEQVQLLFSREYASDWRQKFGV